MPTPAPPAGVKLVMVGGAAPPDELPLDELALSLLPDELPLDELELSPLPDTLPLEAPALLADAPWELEPDVLAPVEVAPLVDEAAVALVEPAEVVVEVELPELEDVAELADAAADAALLVVEPAEAPSQPATARRADVSRRRACMTVTLCDGELLASVF